MIDSREQQLNELARQTDGAISRLTTTQIANGIRILGARAIDVDRAAGAQRRSCPVCDCASSMTLTSKAPAAPTPGPSKRPWISAGRCIARESDLTVTASACSCGPNRPRSSKPCRCARESSKPCSANRASRSIVSCACMACPPATRALVPLACWMYAHERTHSPTARCRAPLQRQWQRRAACRRQGRRPYRGKNHRDGSRAQRAAAGRRCARHHAVEIDLGREIPRDLYVAVAHVLAFAWSVSGKKNVEVREDAHLIPQR